jgi:hypothetical protein
MTVPKKKTTRAIATVAKSAGEQMFIRLPLRPELVTLVRERVDSLQALFSSAASLLELVSEADSKIRELATGCADVATILEGDVSKIAGVVKRRRAKR